MNAVPAMSDPFFVSLTAITAIAVVAIIAIVFGKRMRAIVGKEGVEIQTGDECDVSVQSKNGSD